MLDTGYWILDTGYQGVGGRGNSQVTRLVEDSFYQ